MALCYFPPTFAMQSCRRGKSEGVRNTLVRRGVGVEVNHAGYESAMRQLNEKIIAFYPPRWHERYATELREFCARSGVPDGFRVAYRFLPLACMCRPLADAPLYLNASPGAFDRWAVNVVIWMRVSFAAAELLVRPPLSPDAVAKRIRTRWHRGIAGRVAIVRLLLAGERVDWMDPSSANVRFEWSETIFTPGMAPPNPDPFEEALYSEWIEPALADLQRWPTERLHSHH